MLSRSVLPGVAITAALVAPAGWIVPARAQSPAAALSISHIDMKPTADGFYDATVGFAMKDAKLGATGGVAFSIVVPHVHDADEAIDKVHEPIKTFGDDLERGYKDIKREP